MSCSAERWPMVDRELHRIEISVPAVCDEMIVPLYMHEYILYVVNIWMRPLFAFKIQIWQSERAKIQRAASWRWNNSRDRPSARTTE